MRYLPLFALLPLASVAGDDPASFLPASPAATVTIDVEVAPPCNVPTARLLGARHIGAAKLFRQADQSKPIYVEPGRYEVALGCFRVANPKTNQCEEFGRRKLEQNRGFFDLTAEANTEYRFRCDLEDGKTVFSYLSRSAAPSPPQ